MELFATIEGRANSLAETYGSWIALLPNVAYTLLIFITLPTICYLIVAYNEKKPVGVPLVAILISAGVSIAACATIYAVGQDQPTVKNAKLASALLDGRWADPTPLDGGTPCNTAYIDFRVDVIGKRLNTIASNNKEHSYDLGAADTETGSVIIFEETGDRIYYLRSGNNLTQLGDPMVELIRCD